MDFTFKFLNIFFTLLSVAIVARVLLSWLSRNGHHGEFHHFIWSITEPMLRPIRDRMPPYQGLDFSPIILLILLDIIHSLIVRLLISL